MCGLVGARARARVCGVLAFKVFGAGWPGLARNCSNTQRASAACVIVCMRVCQCAYVCAPVVRARVCVRARLASISIKFFSTCRSDLCRRRRRRIGGVPISRVACVVTVQP